jgi:hypothetical protein
MDSPLAKREQSGIITVEPNCADESNIGQNISSIENRAISIVSFDSRADLSTPRGYGSISDLDIFQFQQLSLLRLNTVSSFADQFDWLEIVDPFLHFREQGASGQGDAGHDYHESLHNESSVNSSSATLSRHRWLVKKCGRILRVEAHIIEEWQGDSSCGIVTALRPG